MDFELKEPNELTQAELKVELIVSKRAFMQCTLCGHSICLIDGNKKDMALHFTLAHGLKGLKESRRKYSKRQEYEKAKAEAANN